MPTADPPDPTSDKRMPSADAAAPGAGAAGAGTTAASRRWRTAAFVLFIGEALAPLALAGWALVIMVTGRAVVVRNDLLVGVLMLITGLGLLLVAVRVREGRRGVRVAALLWQALLVLAVALPMWQVGRPLAATAVAAWAAATAVATVMATAAREPGAVSPR